MRSGVLTSVHAFASDPERGLFILIFLVLVIGCSFLLFAWRGSSVGTTSTFGALSRESMLLGNNLVLVVAMASVLLGTLYPLALDALGGGKISVGAPYFNAVFGAIMIPMAFLLAPGAMASWKNQDGKKLVREMFPAFVLSAVAAVAIPFLLGEFFWIEAVAAFLTVWILAGVATDLVKYARVARRQGRTGLSQGAGWWGMHLAHVGVALLIFGSATVSLYEVERNVTMYPNDVVEIRDTTFRYNGWSEYRGPNYQAAKGSLSILSGGEELMELNPEKRNYDSVSSMTMTEAAIWHRPHEDVYVSLATPTPDGNGWVVRAYVKPFVLFIWIGTLFMALGGSIALFDRRKA